MSEWIRAEEALPETHAAVAMLTEDQTVYAGHFDPGDVLCLGWVVNETGCGCCSYTPKVTHWFLLPEPPEEE